MATMGPRARPRPRTRGHVVVAAVTVAVAVAGAAAWAAPREQVDLPERDASPEEVVRTYLQAVDARDFDTANTIDARPGSTLGRLSRPMTAHDVVFEEPRLEGVQAHVLFTADFSGGDGTVPDGLWGYYLERDADGRWRIVDAGVA